MASIVEVPSGGKDVFRGKEEEDTQIDPNTPPKHKKIEPVHQK